MTVAPEDFRNNVAGRLGRLQHIPSRSLQESKNGLGMVLGQFAASRESSRHTLDVMTGLIHNFVMAMASTLLAWYNLPGCDLKETCVYCGTAGEKPCVCCTTFECALVGRAW
jgi:hypothetical protein